MLIVVHLKRLFGYLANNPVLIFRIEKKQKSLDDGHRAMEGNQPRVRTLLL